MKKVARAWYFLLCYLAYSAYTVDFTIRTALQSQLTAAYHLDPAVLAAQYNLVNWGLLIGVILFGCLVDTLRFKTCFIWIGLIQILGLIKLLLLSPNTAKDILNHQLTVSMLLMGISEGGIFAVIHPLLAWAYNDPGQSKTKIMCFLHTNWPFIILSVCLFEITLHAHHWDWQLNVYAMFFFPCLYLLAACLVPLPDQLFVHPIPLGTRVRSTLRPGFILLFFCMAFTSTVEHSPRSWIVALVHTELQVPFVFFLLFYNGIQIIFRLASGLIVRWISPPALLCIALALSVLALSILSYAHSHSMFWLGVGLFGTSIAWCWPTFIAIVSDRYPLSGGFGMAFMNSGGFASMLILIPSITALSQSEGINQAFLSMAWYSILTLILISTVYVFFKSQGGYKVLSYSEKSV